MLKTMRIEGPLGASVVKLRSYLPDSISSLDRRMKPEDPSSLSRLSR